MAQLEIRFLTAEKARAGRHVSFRRGYASLEHLRFVFDEAWFIEQPLKAGPSNTSISVGNMQNISGQFDCVPSRLFQRRLADGHWQRAGRLRLRGRCHGGRGNGRRAERGARIGPQLKSEKNVPIGRLRKLPIWPGSKLSM
jgi:hypothetical protein